MDPKFFSYDFRLRWFRLSVTLTGDEPIVSCWAEGLLRGGGGGGMWQWAGADVDVRGGVGENSRAGPPMDPRFFGMPASIRRQQEEMAERAQRIQYLLDQGLPMNYLGF